MRPRDVCSRLEQSHRLRHTSPYAAGLVQLGTSWEEWEDRKHGRRRRQGRASISSSGEMCMTGSTSAGKVMTGSTSAGKVMTGSTSAGKCVWSDVCMESGSVPLEPMS
jgi:hypothetical protein